MPTSWEAKITTIQEVKNLNKLPLEELLGSLMIHELAMKQHNDEERKKSISAIKFVAVDENDEESSEDDEDDEDITLIIKKFKKFMRRRRQGVKKRPMVKEDSSKGKDKKYEQPFCYECKKPRHFKAECSTIKKTFKKTNKKVMVAT